MKFAIKINTNDGWLYITESYFDNYPIVKLFDSFEQADQHASAWRFSNQPENVIVEKYDE